MIERRDYVRASLMAGIGLALVPAAWGQVGRGPQLRRPSSQAPSELIGRVGGAYTRDTAGAAGPLQIATPSQALGLRSRARFGGADYPTPVRLGPVMDAYGGSYLPLLGTPRISDIAGASAFSFVTRLDTPLEGWGPVNVSELPSSPLTAATPKESRFGELLGLAAPVAKEVEPRSSDTLWTGVEERTKTYISDTEAQGYALFRAATAPGLEPEERHNKLDEAMTVLSSVRHLDREAYMPCLVTVHAAIERGQVFTALNNLIEVARRHPEAFRDGPSPARYFSDYRGDTGRSTSFDSQMRSFLQTKPATPTAGDCALEAYCALALGQQARARQALERATQLSHEGTANIHNIEILLNALRYGL
jgi:hypothetical protein